MEFFDSLAKAIGPIGALFAIATAYLYQRNQALTDKIMAAFVNDTQMKSDMLHALTDLKETIANFTSGAKV